jgi:hypothetical protein
MLSVSLLRMFTFIPALLRRCRSVGITTGYWKIGVRFSVGARNFSLLHLVQTGSGAHPVSYPMGSGFFSVGVKRQGHEAEHSPPSSAEVQNA